MRWHSHHTFNVTTGCRVDSGRIGGWDVRPWGRADPDGTLGGEGVEDDGAVPRGDPMDDDMARLHGYDPIEVPTQVDRFLATNAGPITVAEIDAVLRRCPRFEHLVPYDLCDALRFLHSTGRVSWTGERLTIGTLVRAVAP